MASRLFEAYRHLIDAKKLEREGRSEEAKIAWVKSRDIYEEICSETEPHNQNGRRARLGLVKTTFKSEGLDMATKLLTSMIKTGDILPRTFDELRTYLGIKPKD